MQPNWRVNCEKKGGLFTGAIDFPCFVDAVSICQLAWLMGVVRRAFILLAGMSRSFPFHLSYQYEKSNQPLPPLCNALYKQNPVSAAEIPMSTHRDAIPISISFEVT